MKAVYKYIKTKIFVPQLYLSHSPEVIIFFLVFNSSATILQLTFELNNMSWIAF